MEKKNVFRRIRQWWNHRSIREQIFFSMLFVTLAITVVLGNLAFYVSKKTIEKNYQQTHEDSLKTSSKILNLQLDNIIEICRAPLSDAEFAAAFTQTSNDGEEEFDYPQKKTLQTFSRQISSQDVLINSIAFMDLNGHYYLYNNIGKGTYNFYNYYRTHDFLKEDWSASAREADGKEIFFPQGVTAGGSKEEICFAKYLIDPSSRKPMGYMVVNLSKRIFDKSFVSSSGEYQTNQYMVLTGEKDTVMVYSEREDEENGAIMEEYTQGGKGSYLFSEVENSITGWTLVNVIDKSELSLESQMIRTAVLACEAVILILCFFLARMISHRITKPLNQLEKTIQSVGEGERHITEEFDSSEVGIIGQKFKEMVNNNLELSEHLLSAQLNEREAELLLLQSQINPHFLYNTLDSLYCMAIIHGDDQIAEMILALSNTFKLSLNNGEKFITVEDSIRRIEEYMKLQNMRYNNRFDLVIEVEEDILQEKIITFILQPFVENSMYHGLEPKIGRGKIRMQGCRNGKNLIFVIEDDGVGIEDLSALESGYGIRNVRERINLLYGEEYGVEVESSVGIGTRITITVPA